MEDKIISYIERYYHTKRALLLGFAAIFLLIILPADNFFEKGIPVFHQRLIFYVFLEMVWLIAWAVWRSYFPACHPSRLGVVVCISTENQKQLQRIRTDFVKHLEELFKQHHLNEMSQVLVMNDYQSKRATSIMTDFLMAQDKKRKSPRPYSPDKTITRKIDRWKKFNSKVKGSFFVYGNIIERQDQDNKYFLNMDGLVVHKEVPFQTSDAITKEFIAVMPKEISFFEKLEFQGFQFTANMVFLAVKYVTGIAALVSGKPALAIQLHDGLLGEFQKFRPLPPNLAHVRSQLIRIMSEEYYLLYRHEYYVKQDKRKAKELLEKCLSIDPCNYSAIVAASYMKFVEESAPVEALKLLLRAKKYAHGNFLWLYNEAFLFMYLKKFKKAIRDYKKLQQLNFRGEQKIVEECIVFNENIVRKEPDKKQFLYVLGLLHYKKLGNCPMGLKYFDQFLNESTGMPDFDELRVRAQSYKADIEREMGLSGKSAG